VHRHLRRGATPKENFVVVVRGYNRKWPIVREKLLGVMGKIPVAHRGREMATLTEVASQIGNDGDWGTAHGYTLISISSSPFAAAFAELLAETKDKLVNLEIQVAVVAQLAQHSDSIPPALNTAVRCAQSQIEPFRDSLQAMEHASSGLVTALGRATMQAEQATKKLNQVEAEIKLLRDRQSGLSTARVDTLEMELAHGSTEIAQIRLVHADMWDSWQAATTELERSTERCRMLEQEISHFRSRAAELDTRVNELHLSTSWRLTAPLRWLRRTLSRRQ
jgi:hypothetical protein